MNNSTHNMKSSYFQTPRTMDEAVWHPWGAAVEIPAVQRNNAYDVVVYVLAFAVVCMTVYILMVN